MIPNTTTPVHLEVVNSPTTLMEFITQVGKSNVLAPGDVRSFLEIAYRCGTPNATAAACLSRGLLTPFQLNAIHDGRALALGDYTLLDFIGKGGMGEVFRARQIYTRQVNAIKVLHPDRARDRDAVERFFREIHNQSKLQHDNVVRVHTASLHDGRPYFAMELVHGATLAERLLSGPLPVVEAVRVLLQSAIALHYAWNTHHVIHRDFKPANAMVTDTGDVKLLDFGLSRTLGGDEQTLTRPGILMGTLNYLAPEQSDAHSVDHRADIYSLGCTAYHVLAGQVPFPVVGLQAKLDAHRTCTAPPLRARRPDVPEPLEALVLRMMAKTPADRPTYEEVIGRLAR